MESLDYLIDNAASILGVVLIFIGVYVIYQGKKANDKALKMMEYANKRERTSIDRLYAAKDLVRKANAKMEGFKNHINENIPNFEIVMVPKGQNPIDFITNHVSDSKGLHPLEICRDMDYDYFMDNCVENWTLEDINYVIPEFEKLGINDKADILRVHIGKK